MTPPEFRGRDSVENPSGRVGGARIELTPSDNGTRLGYCYQQIPMRVMPPFQFDSEIASLLYLINLTAGLLNGDAHAIEVTARSGAHAVVTNQSASRVHPALDSFATQQWRVRVEDDACLVVLPGPTIPFRDSRYFQRARVDLAARARLIWGDIWLPGRYDRGELSERFVFEQIVQDFEARREGRLTYRERFCWDGPWNQQAADWFWGGQLACASLFVGGPMPKSLPQVDSGIRRSIFPLDSGETCVRWCGQPTSVTMDLVRLALHVAGNWSNGPGARPWLLESGDLAPNHWFSIPRSI